MEQPNIQQEAAELLGNKKSVETTAAQQRMHTMKSDADEAIKKQNETAVSIALAEEKKRQQEQKEKAQNQQEVEVPLPQQRRGRFFVVIILILITISIVALYMFVFPKLQNIKLPTVTVPTFNRPLPATTTPLPIVPKVEPLAASLIPAQSEKRFNITKETFSQITTTITEERKMGTTAGSIKNLYFAEESDIGATSVSTSRFFNFIGITTPALIARSFENSFMVGFFGEPNGGATPFFVLKISNPEAGVAGMLEWEPNLPKLFTSLFGTQEGPQALSAKKFRDVVIAGKDARVFEISPTVNIIYSFINKDTIVITESKAALESLIPLAAKN